MTGFIEHATIHRAHRFWNSSLPEALRKVAQWLDAHPNANIWDISFEQDQDEYENVHYLVVVYEYIGLDSNVLKNEYEGNI